MTIRTRFSSNDWSRPADGQAGRRRQQDRLRAEVQGKADAEHRHDAQRADAVQPAGPPRPLPALRRTRVTTPSSTMAMPITISSFPSEGLVVARTSGKRLTRHGRQRDGGEGADHRAGQEGEPGARATLREQDEDGGGDGDAAQRRREGQRYQPEAGPAPSRLRSRPSPPACRPGPLILHDTYWRTSSGQPMSAVVRRAVSRCPVRCTEQSNWGLRRARSDRSASYGVRAVTGRRI